MLVQVLAVPLLFVTHRYRMQKGTKGNMWGVGVLESQKSFEDACLALPADKVVAVIVFSDCCYGILSGNTSLQAY